MTETASTCGLGSDGGWRGATCRAVAALWMTACAMVATA